MCAALAASTLYFALRRGELYIPKGFNELEKITIAEALQASCKAHWQSQGYRRTSVECLCKEAGISKGAFYLFFVSKEQLFLQTLQRTRKDLYALMQELVSCRPNKSGIIMAMKAAYLAYGENSFLYDTKTSDYAAFVEHLPIEDRAKAEGDIAHCLCTLMCDYKLVVHTDTHIAASSLALLLLSISSKDSILCEHSEVFELMLLHLAEDLIA